MVLGIDKSGGDGSLHPSLGIVALASKGKSLDITRRSTIQIQNTGLKTLPVVDI